MFVVVEINLDVCCIILRWVLCPAVSACVLHSGFTFVWRQYIKVEHYTL